MNDKKQLSAMGEHLAEQQQPMCMAKRIEELEAQVRVMAGLLREAVSWMDDHPAMPDSSMMHAALAGKLPASVVPEGWQLVPVEPTDRMYVAGNSAYWSTPTNRGAIISTYSAMLAAAPSPDSDK